jgi:flavin reductase (DIM6/NTAB) family NADH-FMN oxidoreductase RutF
LNPEGLIALAIQPRIPNATEATAQETGKFLVNLLTVAGFEQVRLETKAMEPVSVVCALGIKKQS